MKRFLFFILCGFVFCTLTSAQATETTLYGKTLGVWKLAATNGTAPALIVMDGKGGFSCYTRVGALHSKGKLHYVSNTNDDDAQYDMYNLKQERINVMYFYSDSEFHVGEERNSIYVKKPLTSPK